MYRKAKLFRHYSNQVPRGSFYGINNDSSITFVFNPNPTNSKTFKTIGYEGSNGWQVDSIISDQTGPVILRNFAGNTFVDNQDNASLIYSYTEGEYVLTEAQGTVAQDVTASANVNLDPGSITGFIFAGNFIFSDEITQGSRRVVSYNNSTGALVLTEPVNLTSGNIITFNGIVQNTDYLSVFGSNVPPPLTNITVVLF